MTESEAIERQEIVDQQDNTISVEQLAARIERWLSEYISDLLNIPLAEVDNGTRFDRYGLDSSAAVGMTGDLGEWLGAEVDPSAAYDHTTIAELSLALAQDDEIRSAFSNKY